jgi:hypothetical protein
MDYNNFSSTFDKKIFKLYDSDNKNLNITNNYDLSTSEIVYSPTYEQELNLLNIKITQLTNRMNFIKKHVNNENIFDKILRNIKSLTNFLDQIIEKTDEDVVNIGAINLNRNRNNSIEIEFEYE